MVQLPSNINEAEPWSASEQVPPGVYLAAVAECEEQQSSNGNPMLVLTWRIATGEWTGAELREWAALVESAAGKIVALLQALGVAIPADGMLDPKALIGKRASIVVRSESYTVTNDGVTEEREGSKIKGYRAPDLAPGSDVPSGGFAQPVGARPDDDDIPF